MVLLRRGASARCFCARVCVFCRVLTSNGGGVSGIDHPRDRTPECLIVSVQCTDLQCVSGRCIMLALHVIGQGVVEAGAGRASGTSGHSTKGPAFHDCGILE